MVVELKWFALGFIAGMAVFPGWLIVAYWFEVLRHGRRTRWTSPYHYAPKSGNESDIKLWELERQKDRMSALRPDHGAREEPE